MPLTETEKSEVVKFAMLLDENCTSEELSCIVQNESAVINKIEEILNKQSAKNIDR